MKRHVGRPTLVCRSVCGALIAAPLLYWSLMTDGDAYIFLALVLVAPVAGLVLFANSIYALFRYRDRRSVAISLIFILVSPAGGFTAAYFLPRFECDAVRRCG